MSSPDNHLYEFESFVLDARGRILLNDGATVRLTPRAFQTLLVLVQHATQVVDKEQLLKEVWPDIFVEEGNLSRNIHELRKALGDDSSEPRYIETIPKRGYRFIAPVTVSAIASRRPGFDSKESDATVIEKHTFARVVSKELDESEAAFLPLTQLSGGGEAPARPPGRRTKQILVLLVIGIAITSAVAALVFYLRHQRLVFVHIGRGSAEPASSRAKSTLLRLTTND